MGREIVVQVLRRSASVVRERGLARGMIEDREGHLCLSGAIVEALQQVDGATFEHHDLALGAANRRVVAMGLPHTVRADGYGDRADAAIQWSNDWARDADEVAEILKLTAEDVELGLA